MANHKRKKPKSQRSKNAWTKEANGKGRGDHVPERQAAENELRKAMKGYTVVAIGEPVVF